MVIKLETGISILKSLETQNRNFTSAYTIKSKVFLLHVWLLYYRHVWEVLHGICIFVITN